MRSWFLALALAGCISPGDVICGDGLICPDDTVCRQVAVWPNPADVLTESRCVPVADLAECEGKDEGAGCDPAGIAINGECHSGGCFEVRCGNHFLDAGEACDDANDAFGDGCSIGCLSDETCGNDFVDPVIVTEQIVSTLEQCDGGNRAPHDGCDLTCQLEAPRWRERRIGNPPDRSGAAMVYDARDHAFVMFGGDPENSLLFDDTWLGSLVPCANSALTCFTWTQALPDMQPTARRSHAMAFDAARGVTLMFGGETKASAAPAQYLGDTWAWDGRTWTPQATPVSPPARSRAAMAYDSRRQRVVLYGGADTATGPFFHHASHLFDDTWEWDGAAWIPVIPEGSGRPGPGVQLDAAMAFDPVRGVTVLVGSEINDIGIRQLTVYEWDGASWTSKRPAPAPSSRTKAALAFDPILRQLVLFGGNDLFAANSSSKETWAWDGTAWTLVDSTGVQREQAAYASDATGRFVIALGRNTQSGLQSSTQIRTASGWVDRVNAQPGTILDQAAAFDAVRGRLVLVEDGQTWEYDGSAWTVRVPSNSPAAERREMVFDEARGNVVLYGSGNAGTETWVWNGSVWTNQTTQLPPSGIDAALTYDAVGARTLLSAGRELWQWDASSGAMDWTLVDPAVPFSRRIQHMMGHDRARDQLVVFGGRPTNDPSVLGDTWVFEAGAWREVTTPGPLPRANAALAWSHARQRLVLFGGRDTANGALQDTWEWDGTRWVQLAIEVLLSPPRRSGHVMTSSPNGVYMIGGTTDELWELRYESLQIEDTCRDDRDWDRDGRAGCHDEDCRGICRPLCTPAVGFDDLEFPAMTCAGVEGPRCGDGVQDPLESCRSCPEDFPAGCTPVCGDFFCDLGENCAGDCP